MAWSVADAILGSKLFEEVQDWMVELISIYFNERTKENGRKTLDRRAGSKTVSSKRGTRQKDFRLQNQVNLFETQTLHGTAHICLHQLGVVGKGSMGRHIFQSHGVSRQWSWVPQIPAAKVFARGTSLESIGEFHRSETGREISRDAFGPRR